MKQHISRLVEGSSTAVWKVLAGVMFGFAFMASPAVAAGSCPAVPLSQPFSAYGDLNYYTLVPNGTFNNTSGGGWQMSGGAKIVATTLPNGASGYALSLPHGAKAISPAMCVDASYAFARTWVKALNNSPGLGITGLAGGHQQSQTIKGSSNGAWTLPPAVNVLPNVTGAVQLQLVLESMGSSGSNLVYDLYVDPRMR
jgi:hypothetical protein